ncbi:hypothetical protein [Streptomyces otsuchiensis]|uniref:hypothetical protein n=1 Tax=Streptomyces otsuchiensis TaxID=2681388 RepID=UPI00103221D9|nr:hypothetical protein [Streptomyces otsuchiensis]
MPVEIEMRARFDEAQHEELITRLEEIGEDLGHDNKTIIFYVLDAGLLKVTDNLTAGSAKITWKSGRIGDGPAFPEQEIPIAREDIGRAVEILDAIGFAERRHEAFTRRRNFRFRGVEIAVKWSQAWGYHAEFELLLPDDAASPAARSDAAAQIGTVASSLGIRLMSEAELAAFTRAFEEAERDRRAAETASG